MPDLAAICARLAACQAVVQVNQIFGGKVEDIYLDYERDVDALLAALDEAEEKSKGAMALLLQQDEAMAGLKRSLSDAIDTAVSAEHRFVALNAKEQKV